MKQAKLKEGWARNSRDIKNDVPKGLIGKVLGENVFVEQWWTPILWNDEEDPTFCKTAGLEFFNSESEAEHDSRRIEK